jgi:hypothetical protein
LAGDVPGGDIIEVVQLVGADLLSPYAPAEVFVVEEDGADGGVCPPRGSRWGFRLGSCAAGEGTFSAVRMLAICLRPYPTANISKIRRTTEAVKGSASSRWSRWPRARFFGIGMLAGVCEPVAVGRATAKMAAARLGQHRHSVTHTDPDQVAFLLRRAPEHPEQHLGGGRAEVDLSSDLGEP